MVSVGFDSLHAHSANHQPKEINQKYFMKGRYSLCEEKILKTLVR